MPHRMAADEKGNWETKEKQMKELSMLNPLMKRGSEFLGVEYPILCGAMTWVSEP